MVGYAGAAAFGRIARPRLAASGRNPVAARAPWYSPHRAHWPGGGRCCLMVAAAASSASFLTCQGIE